MEEFKPQKTLEQLNEERDARREQTQDEKTKLDKKLKSVRDKIQLLEAQLAFSRQPSPFDGFRKARKNTFAEEIEALRKEEEAIVVQLERCS